MESWFHQEETRIVYSSGLMYTLYTVLDIKSVLLFKHHLFIQRPCLNENDCILCMQIYIFSITPCQASNGSRVGPALVNSSLLS